eukprot:scaffold315475_cov33-Tisochrysis_lutea.AAC.1
MREEKLESHQSAILGRREGADHPIRIRRALPSPSPPEQGTRRSRHKARPCDVQVHLQWMLHAHLVVDCAPPQALAFALRLRSSHSVH